MGKQWKQWQTIFLGSKITADDDCSHEIKRRLLLGGKVMTNLDSISKGRDIALLTKISLVKAMVFQVVMCGYESWTIKKVECQRIDAFVLWCWRRFVSVLWTARRSNQSILKEISPEYSLEGQMLKQKLQYFGHLIRRLIKDPDSGKDWRQEEKGMTEDETVGWHHWLSGHEQALGIGDGQGSLVCCSPWAQRVGPSRATELNWIYIYVNATLTIHPPHLFPHCVHKFILYIGVSIPALQIGSSAPFF